jgi:hypothetical protein
MVATKPRVRNHIDGDLCNLFTDRYRLFTKRNKLFLDSRRRIERSKMLKMHTMPMIAWVQAIMVGAGLQAIMRPRSRRVKGLAPERKGSEMAKVDPIQVRRLLEGCGYLARR